MGDFTHLEFCFARHCLSIVAKAMYGFDCAYSLGTYRGLNGRGGVLLFVSSGPRGQRRKKVLLGYDIYHKFSARFKDRILNARATFSFVHCKASLGALKYVLELAILQVHQHP